MLYTWGSITKPLTGATILRLQEKGLLNVNDHIVKYIDPFLKKMRTKHPDQNIPSSLRDLFGIKIELVTIQDLATMTLGKNLIYFSVILGAIAFFLTHYDKASVIFYLFVYFLNV